MARKPLIINVVQIETAEVGFNAVDGRSVSLRRAVPRVPEHAERKR
jgi:hypothetical protein